MEVINLDKNYGWVHDYHLMMLPTFLMKRSGLHYQPRGAILVWFIMAELIVLKSFMLGSIWAKFYALCHYQLPHIRASISGRIIS